MRKLAIHIILFGLLGAVLGSSGFGLYSWQFWSILLICVGIGVNSENK